MASQRIIGGTFTEYRSTSAVGNHHNRTDISSCGRIPILAVSHGTIAIAYDDGGT